MKSCLGMVGLFALLELFVVGLGLGVGFLLSWLLPSIGLGSGAVVGVIATGIAMYVFARIITSPAFVDDPDTDVILNSPTQTFIASLDTIPTRPRRKRKSSGPRDVGRSPQS